MIVVIADDLTGAAELSGIGLRYGLTVEVVLETNLKSDADLLIIATDTRSLKKKEALTKTRHLTRRIAKLKPELIFKKVDSVLRGYVTEEIKIHLAELPYKRALLVPFNPSRGRIIANGHYYVNDKPLHLTGFGIDPDFPIATSDVAALLSVEGMAVEVKKAAPLDGLKGLIVGEVQTEDDLLAWINYIDPDTFIAGAAGFFTAILESRNFRKERYTEAAAPDFHAPVLIVSGTAFGERCNTIKQMKLDGEPVSYMSAEILTQAAADEHYHHWLQEIREYLDQFGRAYIAIDPELALANPVESADLRRKMSIIVEKVFDNINIGELMIEGGATAAEVLKVLSLTKMYPTNELAPGVIRMQSAANPGLSVTLKPGSYAWPASMQFPVLR